MRILNVKDEAVTRGVLDKDIHALPHHIEVTYEDALGVIHTVFAHRDGPFKSPGDIVAAHQAGTLHDNAEERPQPEAPLPPAGPVLDNA